MKSFIAAIGLIAVASAAPNDNYNGLEAPPYISLPQAGGFEERLYLGGLKWACTTGGTHQVMFDRLFGYITGSNIDNAHIPMTVPARTRVPDSGDKTMCLFVPSEFQENPPVPSDSTVFIETLPETTVFTRMVDGYLLLDDWLAEEQALEELVTEAGFSYDTDFVYRCTYDAPFDPSNRRNEVWLVRTD